MSGVVDLRAFIARHTRQQREHATISALALAAYWLAVGIRVGGYDAAARLLRGEG